MAAIPLVLTALSMIGSQRVSLLGTVEPLVTVIAAVAFLSERLVSLQILGAGLVLGALVVLQWPSRAGAAGAPIVESRVVAPTRLE
jgi:drug/metabolite transporter (DMT)-like permease